jgi:hypothetical protein
MAWHQAPVHFLHTFGYIAHVKNASKHLAKLVDRSIPMVFMGYEPGTKAYHFYDPATMRICISRDAVSRRTRLGLGRGEGSRAGRRHRAAPGGYHHVLSWVWSPYCDTFTNKVCDITNAHHAANARHADDRSTNTRNAGRHEVPHGRARATNADTDANAGSGSRIRHPTKWRLDLDNDHEDDVPLCFFAPWRTSLGHLHHPVLQSGR